MMGPWRVVATDEFEEWMIGMKELRCTSEGHLRVLFMFMPNQEGVLLLGGNKSGELKGPKWNDWYRYAIPIADSIADREIGKRRKL